MLRYVINITNWDQNDKKTRGDSSDWVYSMKGVVSD